ncbi:MAG: hypothetical protein ED557_12130 [Balneola sp.]|nr:MAG: hypothetical protein ED557_12130 [Balneola sp.]
MSQIKKARVTKKVESDYQVWQEGSYPKQIDTEIKMTNYLQYIHYNPVKAGFVDSPEDWRYSSMRNYLGIESDYLNTIWLDNQNMLEQILILILVLELLIEEIQVEISLQI